MQKLTLPGVFTQGVMPESNNWDQFLKKATWKVAKI